MRNKPTYTDNNSAQVSWSWDKYKIQKGAIAQLKSKSKLNT